MKVDRIVVSVVLGLLAATSTTAQTRDPEPSTYTLLPLHAGEQVVKGIVRPVPQKETTLLIEVKSEAGQLLRLPKAVTDIEPVSGAFTVTLDDALRSGDRVSVAGATGTAATVARFRTRPVLRDGVYDGARVVHGRVHPRTGVSAVRVKVMRSALENTANAAFDDMASGQSGVEGATASPLIVGEPSFPVRYVQMKAAPVNTFNDIDEFTVTLDAPLVAGQIVVAEAITPAGESGGDSERLTVTDPGSWGRARAYFAGGVVFAKNRADFSKQDLTLTLAIDKSVLQRTDFRLPAEAAAIEAVVESRLPADCRVVSRQAAPANCQQLARDARNDARLRSNGRFTFRQLNTFFDARLTQLPVVESAVQQTTGSTATGEENGSTTNRAAATGTTQAAGTGLRDSRKGAWMQVGAYAPVYGPQTSWVHEGAVNTVFVAPLFRYGIQTIGGKSDTEPTTNARGENDDVFHSWGFGFAVGHQKLSGTINQTPELISYLSVAWGKSEAFQFVDRGTPAPADVTAGNDRFHCEGAADALRCYRFVNPRRTMVEGRLKIPNTALQIGFNADLGDGHDDLRFVFGTRFDIGEAFARLRGFQF